MSWGNSWSSYPVWCDSSCCEREFGSHPGQLDNMIIYIFQKHDIRHNITHFVCMSPSYEDCVVFYSKNNYTWIKGRGHLLE